MEEEMEVQTKKLNPRAVGAGRNCMKYLINTTFCQ